MASASSSFKSVELGPLTGLLDTRSLAHEVPTGGFRWVENMAVSAKGRVCRRPGFEKLFGEDTPYNNQDLHDQLTTPRQPISLLFEAVSTTGVRKLIAGTQNRLYALNMGTGNWQIISGDLGGTPLLSCSDRTWSAAQVEDVVVLTNGFDSPVYWTFDGPSVTQISDLSSIGVTRAQVVASWKGLLFLANVTADGVRVPHRVYWSDFRKPLSFVPAADKSVAGYHDLGSGEDILAILPMADSLLFYTTHGIWEAQVTGDETILSFRQRYAEPMTGAGCLAYKRTLISTGDEHMYFGRDGIYVYNMYTPRPILVDWLHRASAVIFDDIEDGQCGLHVGGFNSNAKEAWFSWTKKGASSKCPQQTLVVNTLYQFCDVVRKGFSAFVNYSPTGSSNLRDFLLQYCACTNAELVEAGQGPEEGGYCTPPTGGECASMATCLYSTKEYETYGVLTEDYTGDADPQSLFAILGDMTVEQICQQEQGAIACSAAQRFIMASTQDLCLKQYGGIYAYEICSNFNACSTYALEGYDSILRSGPIDLKSPHALKLVGRIMVNYDADIQTIPTNLNFRVGAARQPSDPNVDKCPILWRTLPPKPLACASALTAKEHTDAGTRPYLAMQWPVMAGGHFIYWELKVSGTGGSSCFSSVLMDVALKQVKG